MTAAGAIPTRLEPASVPLWRETLFGVDWLSLRLAPVYYGVGVPRGDGAGVVLIPGFLGSDNYLVEMYYWLRRIGYQPYYSRIGRNAECPNVLLDRFLQTMDQAYEETGRKLHLIGHSLGGLLARSAAVQRPEQVAQVICLAAPFRDIRAHPMVLAAAGLVRGRIVGQRKRPSTIKPDCFTGSCTCTFANAARSDLPDSVDRAAIYTPTDGVVDWHSCVEEDDSLNTEVPGTHVGLVFNPQVYRKVAKLLASVRTGDSDKRARSALS